MAADSLKNCPTIHIDDSTEGIDLFAGGAHKRVALAIAETIASIESGAMIGIEVIRWAD